MGYWDIWFGMLLGQIRVYCPKEYGCCVFSYSFTMLGVAVDHWMLYCLCIAILWRRRRSSKLLSLCWSLTVSLFCATTTWTHTNRSMLHCTVLLGGKVASVCITEVGGLYCRKYFSVWPQSKGVVVLSIMACVCYNGQQFSQNSPYPVFPGWFAGQIPPSTAVYLSCWHL